MPFNCIFQVNWKC